MPHKVISKYSRDEGSKTTGAKLPYYVAVSTSKLQWVLSCGQDNPLTARA